MADEEVLTEEESDALLEQSEDQTHEPASGVHEPGNEFWEQVSLDRIPALETLNENLGDALTEVWQALLQRKIVVSPQPPRFMVGRRLSGSIEFEQSIRSFDLQPGGTQCLLIVQPETVSAMVDVCFGGAGNGRRAERLAALTEMERRVFNRFCDSMRDALNDVWRRNANVTLQESEETFDASSHSLCEPGVRTVACRLLFDIGQEQHFVEFVWPQELIDSLKKKAPKALPSAKLPGGGDWSQHLSEEVKGARLELRAVIGGISLRLHEISKAKAGDIIMTEQLDKVCLLAGNKPVFEGTLGSHEGFNAVKINQPYVQRRSGDA